MIDYSLTNALFNSVFSNNIRKNGLKWTELILLYLVHIMVMSSKLNFLRWSILHNYIHNCTISTIAWHQLVSLISYITQQWKLCYNYQNYINLLIHFFQSLKFFLYQEAYSASYIVLHRVVGRPVESIEAEDVFIIVHISMHSNRSIFVKIFLRLFWWYHCYCEGLYCC